MIERIRVSKPGHAERLIPRRELADAIASGWVPVWNQSLETLAQQVDVLREAVVDLADSTAAPAPVPGDAPLGTIDYNQLTNKPTLGTAASKDTGTGATQVVLGNDARLSDARTPTAHTHPVAEVTGLAAVATTGAYTDLTGRPTLGTMASQGKSTVDITGGSITGITDLAVGDGGTGASIPADARANLGLKGAAVCDIGTTAGTVAAGNDPRLSDARTPTAHTHPAAQVTGLATVATTGDYNDLANKPASGSGPLVAKTAADQPLTTVTLANITGLSFTAAANTAYQFEALLAITSAATTTGWQFGITAPAVTSFLAVCDYQSSATAWTAATLTAPGGFTLVTAAYAAATPIMVRITGLVVPSSAGTVQFQCRSEVAGSAITVKRGAVLTVT